MVRRKYTKEFKIEAVRLAEDSDVAMTQEEAFSPTSEVSEDKLDEVANSANENMSNWARVCPSFGAYSPKYMESCTECGVAFKPRKSHDRMVPCPMCNGTGTIYLKYLNDYDSLEWNQEDRWLPCSDCDGSGEIPKSVIIDRKNKIFVKRLLEFLSGFLPRPGR